MKTKKKRSSLKFGPVFGPKLGAGQKQRSSPTVCVLKPSAQVTKRGPCRNFASYSMLIILSWRPKGGAWPPPKYAPDTNKFAVIYQYAFPGNTVLHFIITHYFLLNLYAG